MEKILWFMFATYCVPVFGVSACELAIADQVALLAERSNAPPPGASAAAPLFQTEVKCVEKNGIVVVAEPNADYLYLLDTRRIFNRWSTTGAVGQKGGVVQSLRSFQWLYNTMDEQAQWREFGVVGLTIPPLEQIMSKSGWSTITLLDKAKYDMYMTASITPERQKLLEGLARWNIRAWLAVNEKLVGQISSETFSKVSKYSNNLDVSVSVRNSAGTSSFQFRLPLAPDRPPYVGYPHRSNPPMH